MDTKFYTVTVYTENNVGLLNQVTIIFTRRNINIESLTVSKSSISGVHKFTITVNTTETAIRKVVKQIEKRIDVLKAFYYTDEEVIYQEVALFKIPTDSLFDNKELESLVRKYNARILEVNKTYSVIEMAGHTDEIGALLKELNKYGILQFVRSGRVAITRSTEERVSDFLAELEAKKMKMQKKLTK